MRRKHLTPRPHPAWHQKWHASALRRMFFVALFSVLLSFILWGLGHQIGLDVQLVYSLSTGLSIWFLADVVRHQLFPAETGEWVRSRSVWLYISACIVIGFVVGSLIGDHYAGWSTFDLLKFAPQKLAGLIVMCLAISLAFITFFYQQNRLHVVQAQATESKLQLLQSQLEPHMLFNTLANLRVLIDLDSARAQAMLDRLIDYLRATLGASRVTTHALALEFDRLDDYLALMQIRMGSRLRYQLDLPDALKTLPCPALLLQPLVENAVLHGLEPSAEGGEIHVSASLSGSDLILTVADTGLGIAPIANHASETGFGLLQIRERLAMLHGERAALAIVPNPPRGTRVTLTLPQPTAHEANHCAYC